MCRSRRQPTWHALRSCDGTTTLEFAIAGMLIFSLLFGIIELSGALYSFVVLSHAADEGLRYAIVHSSDGNALVANTTAKVVKEVSISFHDTSGMTVTVAAPDGSFAPPNRVSVSLRYPFVPYLRLFLPDPPTMTAFAQGRMVY
jgi:Flp pilus assembly protein TadG